MAYIDYRYPGKMSNILRISSIHSDVVPSHLALYRVLVHGPSPLSRIRREMIAVAVSQINDCHY
jgi:alkylhydroperoxidase family enzyme